MFVSRAHGLHGFEDENGQAWTTEFAGPLNGYTYVAAVDLDGLRTQIANAATEDERRPQTRLDRSVGALMLEEAQQLLIPLIPRHSTLGWLHVTHLVRMQLMSTKRHFEMLLLL